MGKGETKRRMCIALYNRELHKSNICPGNHEVHYNRGWFYFDGKPRRRPDLVREAESLLKQGLNSRYCETFNTYVLDR